MLTGKKRLFTILAGVVLGVATLFFAARSLSGAVNHLEVAGPQAGVALGLMVAAVVGSGITWIIMVRYLDASRPSLAKLLRFFLMTWPVRYVPGTLPYHAGRILIADRFSLSRRAVATSIAYEAVLQMAAAAFVGVLGMALAVPPGGEAWLIYALVMPALAVTAVCLQPRVLLPIANRVLRLAKRQSISGEHMLTGRQTVRAFLSYALVYVANGIAFYTILEGVTDGNVNVLLAIGVYNLAGAAGILAVFAPSGLGVREGVIVALLAGSLPAEDVILAAATARGISVIGDLLPAGVLMIIEAGWRTIERLRRLPRRAEPRSSEAGLVQ